MPKNLRLKLFSFHLLFYFFSYSSFNHFSTLSGPLFSSIHSDSIYWAAVAFILYQALFSLGSITEWNKPCLCGSSLLQPVVWPYSLPVLSSWGSGATVSGALWQHRPLPPWTWAARSACREPTAEPWPSPHICNPGLQGRPLPGSCRQPSLTSSLIPPVLSSLKFLTAFTSRWPRGVTEKMGTPSWTHSLLLTTRFGVPASAQTRPPALESYSLLAFFASRCTVRCWFVWFSLLWS